MSSQQHQYDRLESDPASESHTPLRKGKKRVGWHSSSNSAGGEEETASSADVPPQTIVHDLNDPGIYSPVSSPPSPRFSGSVPSGAPDPRELTSALSAIMTPDGRLMPHQQPHQQLHLPHQPLQPLQQTHQSQQQQENDESSASPHADTTPPLQTSQEAHNLRVPSRPRPALRRNTSYDDPAERETADKAEKSASERQQRSMNDARSRADRLADSLGSGPASRRQSRELLDTFQPQPWVSDHHDADDDDETWDPSALDPTPATPPDANFHLRRRARPTVATEEVQNNQTPPDLQPSDDYDDLAADLVRSYTRGRKDLFHPTAHKGSSSSGTNTPIAVPEDGDYVPRPHRYRGGVLASLLKLQRDDRGRSSGGGSGQNTPSAPTSPFASPGPSPPTSRPASIIGSPRSRPSSGSFFNLHRSNHSASSMTLTELMKSSSMLAGPGSGGISDHVAEKIRKETAPPPKSKKEQIRITVHIAGIIARHKYLLKLCRALMMYGAPTHRLEEYMAMSARVLEIEGQFLYIPSCMIISFDDSTTHTTEVKVVRVPQGIDLGRLRDIHNIYKEVVHDKLGVEEATKRLDQVMKRGPKFNKFFRVFLYGIASACVAPFAFQGRFIDLPIAFILGCLVGLLQLVFAPSNELYAHVFEVTAAVITSFLARGFGSINNGNLFCFSALAQSSIALILPGYMVLCSSLELQSHNIVAGSVRMVYAMIYTLFLGYGITIGASLYGMLDHNAASSTTCTEPLRREWYFLFVPGFTLSLCIINQAKWKQTPVMVAMALAGFCVNSYCSTYFEQNTQISNMLGALAIGILANLYSRVGRHVTNGWLDLVDWWTYKVRPRITGRKMRSAGGTKDEWPMPSLADSDPESRPGSPEPKVERKPRSVGYSLAAAAMLPAIFVQVPSGLAANGSLLAGITSANQITGNSTTIDTGANTIGNLDGTAFNVLFSVIQVAIGISVGLFMSALIVYPLGKRRSGLFSF